MKIVYVYDAIARIGGVEKILADKMNYFADVCAYDIYLITAAQGNHPFSFPISARVKHIDLNARFHLQYQYKAPLMVEEEAAGLRLRKENKETNSTNRPGHHHCYHLL